MQKITKWVADKGLSREISIVEFREVANKFPSTILLPLTGLIEKLFTGMDVGTVVIPGETCCCGMVATRPFG